VALGAWSLAYEDRDVCVSRVVDCSSLVMHGKFSLCWEIQMAWYLPMFLVLVWNLEIVYSQTQLCHIGVFNG